MPRVIIEVDAERFEKWVKAAEVADLPLEGWVRLMCDVGVPDDLTFVPEKARD
jgi:hypothetical protein